jgi:steroid 5-alpha reductase family enzyme
MRQRNNPGFEWKSLYLVFGLQAVLAWILAAPLAVAVSGVALLEKDIAQRRPAYRDYIARTNAFIPGPPR